MTVVEHLRRHKVVNVTAAAKKRKQTVTVGSARTRTLTAGASRTVAISLNRKGKKLLARFHRITATLKITQSLGNGKTKTVSRQKVTFKARGHHR